MTTMVDLEPNRRNGTYPKESRLIPLKRCRPYVRTSRSTMTHRPRHGTMHYWKDEFSHLTISTWCGQLLYQRNGLLMQEEPDPDMPICAICQAKAIATGQVKPNEIKGHPVAFNPRRRA